MRIEERAPAKINLALHVTGRRADGYHLLDSIVAFAPAAADRLRVRPAAAFSLRVTGPFAAGLETGGDNLVLRAARAMAARWPGKIAPARMTLEKNLPVASGIGGGSADAAAALRALARLSGFAPPPEALAALALELGADVPVCLAGRACRVRGVGERLEAIGDFPPLWAVLANPGVAVSTARVFSALDLPAAGRGLTPLPERGVPPLAEEAAAFLAGLRNDLQRPAVALAPEIARCLAALEAGGEALLARMSGSGATCFALVRDESAAKALRERLRGEHPGWWLASVRLGDAF